MIPRDREFVGRVLGGLSDRQDFNNLRQAALVATTQDALAALLGSFDSFCSQHGIKYFLFSDTLQGVLAYGDFIPGSTKIQLGMLYAEYLQLVKVYEELSSECAGGDLSWEMVLENANGTKKRFPWLRGTAAWPVEYEGEAIFDDESFPLVVQPVIEISVFNAVPDDFLVRKSFFRQANRWNKLFQRCDKARGRIRKSKANILSLDLPFALLPLGFSLGRLFSCARRYEGLGMSSVARMFGTRSKTVPLDVILPYRRDMLHGVETWVPAGDTPWASYPVDEPDEALRDLQSKALGIVSEIHRVCRELGIGYFVCGGTMLGYVRHGGFIPWDDDIDVGMLREDYERFRKEAPKIIDSERFFVQTRESDPGIPYLFTKVRMNNTFYITEYNRYLDFHKGICVDVFPFDAIPNDVEKQKEFRAAVREVEVEHNSLVNHRYPRKLLEAKPEKKEPGYGVAHVLGRMMARYYDAKPLEQTQKAYDEIVQRYNGEAQEGGLEYVACFVPSYTMVKRSDLLPYREVDFEGIRVNVPARPEVFLRMQYGDFAKMPMPHQRVGHGLLDVAEIG